MRTAGIERILRGYNEFSVYIWNCFEDNYGRRRIFSLSLCFLMLYPLIFAFFRLLTILNSGLVRLVLIPLITLNFLKMRKF